MNEKTAVLIGGTFNPFTNAHREMALAIRRAYPEVTIVYVPSNLRYIAGWKDLPSEDVFSGEGREEVIEKSIADIPGCLVSDMESSGALSGKSYDTVHYFKQQYDHVCLCIGYDKLEEFGKWYQVSELVDEIDQLFLFTRGKGLKDCSSDYILSIQDKITEIDFDYPEVSSSLVRELYAQGDLEAIQELVPFPVYECLSGKKFEKEKFQMENLQEENSREEMSMFDVEKVTADLLDWTRAWFEENGKGCKAVIGISGGKDSSVCAAICAKALGVDRVLGVLMPDGVQRDIDDSIRVCDHLGIQKVIVNVHPALEAEYEMLAGVEKELGVEVTAQTRTNLPPRIRMTTLYAVSQTVNGRVINTCNLSEDYVGYSTRYGDSAGDVSLLGGLTVDEVKKVGKYLGLPVDLVDKAPSDGLCGKTDEDNLGFTYAVLDKYIRTGICEDAKIKAKIDRKHVMNEFKLKPLPHFEP